MTEEPTVPPGLQYVLIPAETSTPLKACQCNERNDTALKKEIEKYFQTFGITEGQKQAFQEKVMEQGMQKLAQNTNAELDQPQSIAQTKNLFGHYLNERVTSYEIIPIVMPSFANRFSARSLYIDEVGRFKDLPLNERASKIAQRDIRGDCFMLSNRDDPSSDKWERIDTTLADVNAMIEAPPVYQPDPMSKEGQSAALAAQSKQRIESTILSTERIAEVELRKTEANNLFQSASYEEAITQYSEALEALLGREDSLSEIDQKNLKDLRSSILTNRALCSFKLSRFEQSYDDSKAATEIAHLRKPYLIRIKSSLKLKSFSKCQEAITEATRNFPEDEDIKSLQLTLNERVREDRKREQSLFRNMFSK